MIYLIDDIDKNNNVIENIENCKIKEIKKDSDLYAILKLLCIEE